MDALLRRYRTKRGRQARPAALREWLRSSPTLRGRLRVLRAPNGRNERAAVVVLLVLRHVVGGLAAPRAKGLVLFSPHMGIVGGTNFVRVNSTAD